MILDFCTPRKRNLRHFLIIHNIKIVYGHFTKKEEENMLKTNPSVASNPLVFVVTDRYFRSRCFQQVGTAWFL